MSRKTIPKILAFVIVLLIVASGFSSCGESFKGRGPQPGGLDGKSFDYRAPKVVGRVASAEINEASGIAASKCQPGVLWTHNDSGDDAFIFAIDEKGAALGTWRVAGAENKDWEDIAAFKDAQGKCFLYIGEIGNNELERSEMKVYRVAEPSVSESNRNTRRANAPLTGRAETISFSYADARHNAETLMVNPRSGDIYILTKSRTETSGVYKIPAGQTDGKALTKLAEISVPAIPDGLLTGGDISPDGKRVVVCDYFSAYELTLPEGIADFDEVWRSKPLAIELGKREIGEAIGYSADGRSLFAISEKVRQPMIRVDRN